MYKNYWLRRKAIREDAMIVYGHIPGVATWDFQTALGDTIREKYESLYVKVIEVSNVINRKVIPKEKA